MDIDTLYDTIMDERFFWDIEVKDTIRDETDEEPDEDE
jgi:hypothetical protein